MLWRFAGKLFIPAFRPAMRCGLCPDNRIAPFHPRGIGLGPQWGQRLKWPFYKPLARRQRPVSQKEPASENHNRADGFTGVHQVKTLVDFLERQHMGDHRVNLDLAVHVPIHNFGHIGAAARAAKG